MTDEQVKDAIWQMQSFCRGRVEAGEWESISARGVLYALGYDEDKTDAVLAMLFASGFTYCLDPRFTGAQPVQSFACYWEPDQLLSRLDCVLPRR